MSLACTTFSFWESENLKELVYLYVPLVGGLRASGFVFGSVMCIIDTYLSGIWVAGKKAKILIIFHLLLFFSGFYNIFVINKKQLVINNRKLFFYQKYASLIL